MQQDTSGSPSTATLTRATCFCTARSAFQIQISTVMTRMMMFPRKKLCNKKMTWRRPGTLPNYLGNNFKPAEYLASLYWFASDSSYKAARKQAGVSMKNWRGFATKIRGILRLSVARFSSAQLGGDGRIVCVDETFLTKKSTARVASGAVPLQARRRSYSECLNWI